MRDINNDKFKVRDTLKVIKYAPCGVGLKVGDLVECVGNDNTSACEFKLLSTNKRFYYYNNHLQKL